jgi:hypothetical protein
MSQGFDSVWSKFGKMKLIKILQKFADNGHGSERMSRYRCADIILELVDLCHELMDEIRQQLGYYRVSVYKEETAEHIKSRISHMKLVASLIAPANMMEPFRDYEAMSESGVMNYVPGECSFSRRVSVLMASLGDQLTHVENYTERDSERSQETTITQNVQKHRHQILAMCKYGSRQWSFFRTL